MFLLKCSKIASSTSQTTNSLVKSGLIHRKSWTFQTKNCKYFSQRDIFDPSEQRARVDCTPPVRAFFVSFTCNFHRSCFAFHCTINVTGANHVVNSLGFVVVARERRNLVFHYAIIFNYQKHHSSRFEATGLQLFFFNFLFIFKSILGILGLLSVSIILVFQH